MGLHEFSNSVLRHRACFLWEQALCRHGGLYYKHELDSYEDTPGKNSTSEPFETAVNYQKLKKEDVQELERRLSGDEH